nr:hypothetical protein [Tanacetum cinerariifolium]
MMYSKPENPNELFQKLLEDLKELAEYEKSQSRDPPIFLNDDSDQNKECFENSSDEIAALNPNQEKEIPPQDSNIRKLIREECCIEVYHSDIFSDSKNDDDISFYDDDFEDIEYVEASLPDPDINALLSGVVDMIVENLNLKP